MTKSYWLALAAIAAAAPAQDLPPSKVTGSPPGFDYPMTYDSVRSAPTNHRIVYEDGNVRLIEVTLWPHVKEIMHGHAYPSVFAFYQQQPAMTNESLVDKGPPPFGRVRQAAGAPDWPRCLTLAPQTPHAATITDDYPQHFFRLEFKHSQSTFARDWRRWYPELAGPARALAASSTGGESYSAAWPYPIALATGRAAQANYVKRFDNGMVRMYEVMLRPGETEPLHGSPYYAINAYPSAAPGEPGGPSVSDRQSDPSSPLIARTDLGGAGAPKGLSEPTCSVTGPTAPHQLTNTGKIPLHYYRIEFLRVDGTDYPANWKRWYPGQAEGPPVIQAK